MKSMKNFAAQQLSKKEMNNVKGGVVLHCEWQGADGFPRQLQVRADAAEDAIRMAFDQVPDGTSCRFI